MIIGRLDPKRGITPDIDLTPFDATGTISRRHARIHFEKDLFYIEDLNSRNKTRLDEEVLPSQQSEQLRDGDSVSFGAVKAVFRLLGTSALPAPWE